MLSIIYKSVSGVSKVRNTKIKNTVPYWMVLNSEFLWLPGIFPLYPTVIQKIKTTISLTFLVTVCDK